MRHFKTQRTTSVIAIIAILSVSLSGCASIGLDKQTTSKKKNKKPYITAKLSGRAQIDYTNAKANRSGLKFDEAELRRLYVGVGGDIGRKMSYSLSSNISDSGDVGLVNAYIDWKPAKDWKIRAGQFKTPMSLDESTSSKYTATLERAAFTDAIEIDRRLGVGVFHTGEKHTLAAGFFGNDIEHQPFASGNVASARATFAPISKKSQTIHLGVSARHRTNNKDEGDIRYRQRPYAHVAERIVSTGRIANSDTSFGAEAAIIHKNMWAAGEYNVTKANCSECNSDPSFNGYYAEVGIMIGGRRTYKDGSFGRPKVNNPINDGGKGAVALVARYDGLDLNSQSVTGGDLKTSTVGADWWPTDHWRLSVNYFNTDANLGTSGSGIGQEFSDLQDADIDNEKVSGVTIRAQYDF